MLLDIVSYRSTFVKELELPSTHTRRPIKLVVERRSVIISVIVAFILMLGVYGLEVDTYH